jgi:Domain of unknown function (DUF4388)
MSDRYNGANNGQYNENGDNNGVVKDGHSLRHLFQNNSANQSNDRSKYRATEPLPEAPNISYARRGQTAPVSANDPRLGTGKLNSSPENRVLSGKLAAFSPSSLLSLLNIQKQTGYLHLTNGPTGGAIYVEKGEVFDAKLGSVVGSLALFQLFGWKSGDFSFEVNVNAPEKRTIDASLPVLQVRATLWLDNWSKYNPIIPSTSHRISIAPEPRSEVVIEPYQWPVLTKIVSRPMTIAELAADIDRDLMEVTKIAADLVKMGVAVVYEPLT